MNKTNLLAGSVLAAALGARSFGAQAAEPVGWYARAGIGQSMVDEGWLDEEETGFQVFGGYQWHPNWGVEIAYADLASLDVDTFSAVAVGTLPFTRNFSGYAKAGFHTWHAGWDY